MEDVEVVGAVIIRDGRVYCAQRASGPLAGLWEFPGGKVEPGETPQQALAREVREELGCVVRVGRLVETTTHTYDFAKITLSTFECSVVSGHPRRLEHARSRWLGSEDLGNLDWAPADMPTARRVRIILADTDSTEAQVRRQKVLSRDLNRGAGREQGKC
ncbi:MAG: (deoxy)nucleoside triphosphate pyrophosphohydrolase [Propionibacteriaceae bacterium]|nr:(deoxy)nucleoside triphosphate pyrophosphohydrolase [Propionibacteriaceae bacterium]